MSLFGVKRKEICFKDRNIVARALTHVWRYLKSHRELNIFIFHFLNFHKWLDFVNKTHITPLSRFISVWKKNLLWLWLQINKWTLDKYIRHKQGGKYFQTLFEKYLMQNRDPFYISVRPGLGTIILKQT